MHKHLFNGTYRKKFTPDGAASPTTTNLNLSKSTPTPSAPPWRRTTRRKISRSVHVCGFRLLANSKMVIVTHSEGNKRTVKWRYVREGDRYEFKFKINTTRLHRENIQEKLKELKHDNEVYTIETQSPDFEEELKKYVSEVRCKKIRKNFFQIAWLFVHRE